jgi:catechol 2,3-dioxygenase-like lactoylglutathione lyase family enzyme
VGLNSLDHVALWVSDRDTIADFAVRHFGMHVIERTDRFTLVGADARRGKLTLFEADGPRDQGPLVRVGLRVNDLDRAVAALPSGEGEELEIGEGIRIRLVEAPTDVDYDLDHVALRARSPDEAARAWTDLGFSEPEAVDGGRRLEVAGSFLDLEAGDPGETERPLLNHLGVLVESADDWRRRAEQAGVEVADVVDAPNTYAVFVHAPEHVKLEYVEHKPGFSLE